MWFREKDGKREHPWPWMRDCSSGCFTPDDRNYLLNYVEKQPKFYSVSFDNAYPDLSTKRAAIKASPSVVSVVTYSGDKDVFQGSGTIIEKNGTILTSADLVKCHSSGNVIANNIKVVVYLLGGGSYGAELLAYDLYYNIAIVKIQYEVLLEPAQLRLLDDFLPVDPNEELQIDKNRGFQIRAHSDAYVLVPGDHVTALGRYFITPYDIMVAPGEFSITHCDSSYDCKERFLSTCVITSTGAGGPLVNRYGEVIGIMMYERGFNPFLPINIALKWWDYFKQFRELRQRPLIGMELTNLYSVNMRVMSKVIQKLPGNYSGIYVEQVIQGSNADVAGIRPWDLIVKCNGKTIRGLLEFYDIMWDNTGRSVELDVIRPSCNAPLQLAMTVVEATQARRLDQEKFYDMSVKKEQPKSNIVLLAFNEESVKCVYSKIADNGQVQFLEPIFFIGHLGDFVGSFIPGYTGYPCPDEVPASNFESPKLCRDHKFITAWRRSPPSFRTMGDVYNVGTPSDNFQERLNPLIPLIECVGIVFVDACAGGPVFKANGEIVGMLAMEAQGHSAAIHSTALKAFIGQAN